MKVSCFCNPMKVWPWRNLKTYLHSTINLRSSTIDIELNIELTALWDASNTVLTKLKWRLTNSTHTNQSRKTFKYFFLWCPLTYYIWESFLIQDAFQTIFHSFCFSRNQGRFLLFNKCWYKGLLLLLNFEILLTEMMYKKFGMCLIKKLLFELLP